MQPVTSVEVGMSDRRCDARPDRAERCAGRVHSPRRDLGGGTAPARVGRRCGGVARSAFVVAAAVVVSMTMLPTSGSSPPPSVSSPNGHSR